MSDDTTCGHQLASAKTFQVLPAEFRTHEKKQTERTRSAPFEIVCIAPRLSGCPSQGVSSSRHKAIVVNRDIFASSSATYLKHIQNV
ncbi:hypothetical protein L596_001187 [Steinernema carpocapsae]|uniref:Uncharacterized protein n=1 Tax=Steinernema carpocapsae TaxID=34508 RepID=A0A4U8ULJ7_STECR|nr:hypothetical protein L596_001187 [Steinernema carpocapsae]